MINNIRILDFIKLARNRLNSVESYTKFQRYQAQWIIEGLIEKVDLSGLVLDLGCGIGGYSSELEKRAKKVYALDLDIYSNFPKRNNIIPIFGNALYLPFKDNSLDFIFCSSLIEHVPEPEILLSEINRVLKEDKYLYLSFPPFYTPVGGHQFKPFHLLGETAAIFLTKLVKQIDVTDFKSSYGNIGLFPTTISKVKRLSKTANFKIIDITTRFFPINVAKIPVFKEILTWHVEFLLKKESGSK